jgi:peptidyl-prolyl cis-trans isomerase B (cyclophilin B)
MDEKDIGQWFFDLKVPLGIPKGDACLSKKATKGRANGYWLLVMKYLFSIFVALGFSMSCLAQERAEVLLETTEGNIRIELYNETPLHRDNFMKLVKMQMYDSLLFHRVIKNFMIQGGDLNSKHAQPGQRLGSGELDYTIEPEFRLPQLFHRRGVVAAAREPDEVNPEMRSGACQFYIVWGQVFNDMMIGRVQERLDATTHGRVQLTPEMIEVYKTVGGTPHLDGQYTVFGEVTEGMDVVDKIQQTATDGFNRPYTDVRIIKATLTKDPFKPVEKPQPKKTGVKRKRK